MIEKIILGNFKMQNKRIKRIRIQLDTFIEQGVFSQQDFGPHLKVNGIPQDVKFVSMYPDPMNPGTLFIYIESSEFPEVAEGAVPEDIYITVSTWMCEEYRDFKHPPIIPNDWDGVYKWKE